MSSALRTGQLVLWLLIVPFSLLTQPSAESPHAVAFVAKPPAIQMQQASVAAVIATPTQTPTPTPTPNANPTVVPPPRRTVATPRSGSSPVSGSHEDWLRAAGIPSADWTYVEFIISHEGNWNPCIINGGAVDCAYALNGGTKAYGVCQALPGNKMASAGADWATNPITQLRWCASYAIDRYHSWAGAYAHWLAFHWW